MWSTDCAQPNWSRHRRHGIENKRAYKCDSTGAAQSQDASDGVTRFYRHDCQSGRYSCATQSRWKVSLEQDFQMSECASRSWNALDILFLLTAPLSIGERGVRLLWKKGREALSILLSVRSVRCALKGLDWVEWVRGWEERGRYYQQSMSVYFKVLSGYGRSVHHPRWCWMVGWEKDDSNAIFFSALTLSC